MRLTRAEAKKLGVDAPPRKPKYRNVKTTLDGVTFSSKKEATRYSELRLLEKAGRITDLVLQPEFEFIINGKRVGKYVGDFIFYDIAAAQFVVEDVKSVATRKLSTYRLKKKLVEALHGIRLVEV